MTETGIPFEETPAFGNFTLFTGLLQSTGIAATLEGPGPYTVFAPTNDAFGRIDPDIMADNGVIQGIDTVLIPPET